jgi:putative ABC transport system permease protein
MDSPWQDVRYAFRGLWNQAGFAALAVLTLALGIGATTTMYSVIYNVLFDPFPYKESERVVTFQIREADRATRGGRSFFQGPEWLDYKEQTHVYDEIVATTAEDVLMTTTEGTLQFDGGIVSDNMFSFLGVAPLYGRGLTPDDARPGAAPVFVMAYKMWTKHFNMDPTVVGRTFTLNGVQTACVGVMPRRFTKMNADLYRTISMDRANPEIKDKYFMFQGKVKRGITLAQVEADIGVIAKRLATVYPRNYPEDGKFIVKAVSWVDNIIGPFRQTLTTLAAAVALLLLIACTNVANLLLARATARAREMALRASLGATRGRLVRQLLIESLVLALLGAIVGSVFAWAGVKALVAYIPDGSIPHETVIHLNTRVLLFSLGIAVLTAVIFGLVPALQAARKNLVEPLKDSGKGAGGSFRGGWLRKGLVVFEVGMSLVLLVGAGLLMTSFVKLTTVDMGFEPGKLLIARIPFPRGQYETGPEKQRYFSQLMARLRALPGVTAVTTTTSLPGFGGVGSDIEIRGAQAHTERWTSYATLCSEGYAQALGLKLQRGRFLSEADINSSRRVAVVSAEFVKRYVRNTDPIGRLVTFEVFGRRAEEGGAAADPSPPPENPPFEIIGVVADIKNSGPQDPWEPEAYIPYAVTGNFGRAILLRTAGNPLGLVNSLRREIWAQDKVVAVTDIDSVEGFMRRFVYATPRFSLLVLGVFGTVGLILVAVGIYSVVAYTVSRQTHELGIRMALGAMRADVMRLVIRMGLGLVVLGACIGLLVSVFLTRVLTLTNQLWEVPPNDPLTLASVCAVVTTAGFFACYFPARRATRVDPMIALRHE